MPNQHHGSSDPVKDKPASRPEIDYSPKTYTLSESLVFLGKLFAATAFVAVLLWILKEYIFV